MKTFSPEFAKKVEDYHTLQSMHDLRDYHLSQTDRIFISPSTRRLHWNYWHLCNNVIDEYLGVKL